MLDPRGKFKKFLFGQKYRLDMGYQFLTFINFTLLIITASDKIKPVLKIDATWVFVCLSVFGAFFLIWLFGWFLDVIISYNQAYSFEEAKRNPKWQMQMDGINESVRILKLLEKDLPK